MIDTPPNQIVYIGTVWKDQNHHSFKVIDIFFWNNIKMVLFEATGSYANQLKEAGIKNVFVRTVENFLYDYEELK